MVYLNSKIFKQLINTTLNITKREIKVRYAGSSLGFIWFILQPITFSLIIVLVFSLAFKNTVGDIPYFIYVFAGFNNWLWFSQTIIAATRSPIHNRDLIINNKFPTESIVLGTSFAKVPEFVMGVIFLLILVLIYKSELFHPLGLFYFLIVSLFQLFFQIGLGLLTASINIRLRDFQNVVEIFLQLLFYTTPIIYTIDIVPTAFAKILNLNPLTIFFEEERESLLHASINFQNLAILFLLSSITFVYGYYIYKKAESKYAEIL